MAWRRCLLLNRQFDHRTWNPWRVSCSVERWQCRAPASAVQLCSVLLSRQLIAASCGTASGAASADARRLPTALTSPGHPSVHRAERQVAAGDVGLPGRAAAQREGDRRRRAAQRQAVQRLRAGRQQVLQEGGTGTHARAGAPAGSSVFCGALPNAAAVPCAVPLWIIVDVVLRSCIVPKIEPQCFRMQVRRLVACLPCRAVNVVYCAARVLYPVELHPAALQCIALFPNLPPHPATASCWLHRIPAPPHQSPNATQARQSACNLTLSAAAAAPQECLEDHMDKDGFSSTCKTQLNDQLARRVADFRLDTPLRDACQARNRLFAFC